MAQEFEGIESEVSKIEDREDNTSPVYKLDYWKLCLLIAFYLSSVHLKLHLLSALNDDLKKWPNDPLGIFLQVS